MQGNSFSGNKTPLKNRHYGRAKEYDQHKLKEKRKKKIKVRICSLAATGVLDSSSHSTFIILLIHAECCAFGCHLICFINIARQKSAVMGTEQVSNCGIKNGIRHTNE